MTLSLSGSSTNSRDIYFGLSLGDIKRDYDSFVSGSGIISEVTGTDSNGDPITTLVGQGNSFVYGQKFGLSNATGFKFAPNKTYIAFGSFIIRYHPNYQNLLNKGTYQLYQVNVFSAPFTTPNLKPTLVPTVTGGRSISLSWGPYETATFKVFQSQSAAFTSPIEIYSGPLLTHSVANLNPGTTYYFKVNAVSTYDTYTVDSDIVSVVPLYDSVIPHLTATTTGVDISGALIAALDSLSVNNPSTYSHDYLTIYSKTPIITARVNALIEYLQVESQAGRTTVLPNTSFPDMAFTQLDYNDINDVHGTVSLTTSNLSAIGINSGDTLYVGIRAVSADGVQFSKDGFSQIVYNTAVCFLGDAPVLTARGYRPIREFRVGDVVQTADGREVAVKRVFRREYGPSASANPYVIPKGFLGATRPIAISPNHEVLVPGAGMIKARDLGLKRMKMADNFTYYNLELEDWVRDNLVVAGVAVESLAPAERITMSKAEFARFVKARYGPSAAARLRTVCFEELGGQISLPALK